MTSFAFILGLLPLVIAEGAGAVSRRAVGTPVFGGMIAAAVFGIFVIRCSMSSSSACANGAPAGDRPAPTWRRPPSSAVLLVGESREGESFMQDVAACRSGGAWGLHVVID